MTSFVDVSDAGAAEAAAQRITRRENGSTTGPCTRGRVGGRQVRGGMRSAYFKAQDNGLSPHFACIQEKSKLGKALGEDGRGRYEGFG